MTITFARTRTLLLLLVPPALLILTGTGLASMRRNAGGSPGPLLDQLNLARENVVAVWFSSMLPLLASGACFLCLLARGQADDRDRMHSGWLVLAFAFALMSLDEMGSIHERIAAQRGLLAWALALWPLFLGIPAFMLAFAWFQLRRSPAAFRLLLLGVLCLCSVPLQEYLEAPYYRSDPGWIRPSVPLLLEEGGELLGLLLCLVGCWVFARSLLVEPPTRLVAGNAVRRLAPGLCAGMAVLLGLLLMLDLESGRNLGTIVNWVPSALAVLAALLALNRKRSGLGAVAISLSAFVGGNIYAELELGRAAVTTAVAAMAIVLIARLLREPPLIPPS